MSYKYYKPQFRQLNRQGRRLLQMDALRKSRARYNARSRLRMFARRATWRRRAQRLRALLLTQQFAARVGVDRNLIRLIGRYI